MPTEQTTEDDSWQRIWDARLAALKPILGDAGDMVYHAAMPMFMGGAADVVPFPNHLPGLTLVTADLTGEGVGQHPNSLGKYELMICTRTDVPAAPNLISNLGKYTLEAVLEPGESMDIATYFGDSTLCALLFTHPGESPARFTLEGQQCSLLLCIGITAAELDFKHANGSNALLERLRAADVFPYTIPDRPSVVLLAMTATPNQALQRTAPRVTLAASGPRLSATMQPARRAPQSLSLGSLGDYARLS